MAGDERDDEGKFQETYPDSAFVEAVRTLEVASTQNVADKVGCSYDLAYRRLKEMEEQEMVESQDVGSAFVWIECS